MSSLRAGQIVISGEKGCSKCFEFKPLTDFYKSKTSNSGYTSQCKKCTPNRYVKKGYQHGNQRVVGGKKACSKCGEWKCLDDFFTAKLTSSGHTSQCKSCLQKPKKHRGTQIVINGEKECSKCAELKPLDRFCKAGNNSTGYSSHCKKCRSKEWDIYYKKHGDKVRKTARKNRPKHTERIVKYRDKIKPKRNLAERERAKTDIQFKLNRNIRSSMCHSLKYNGSKNGRHWEDLVGYTLTDLKKHLQKQFIDGMTWENWGINGWHIDHVIPISAFNFTDPSHTDFKRCWSLKNLQPLWAFDNISKNDKLEKPFQPSLAL